MSENIQKESVSGKGLNKAVIAGMLIKNFEKLPALDQNFFSYGDLYLGGNAGLAGLISNSLYRRALNVTQMPVVSSLSMAALPFLITSSVYRLAVLQPLLSGDLNCPTCASVRGALVGLLAAGVYPIFLALPLNICFAAMYNTAPLPEKGNVLQHWVQLSKPVWRKMRAVLLLQVVFGTYLSSRHFEAYIRLVQITSYKEEVED